jgi:hypothetical protein
MAALQALRAQIGAIDTSQKSESFSSASIQSHIPCGALVEIVGPARTQVMVSILAEQQKATNALALWSESDFSVYPIGLLQKGVNLSRLLFVECDKAATWALGQALQSQIFPIIVAANFNFHEKDLRRFQLMSERSRATTFLLSEKRQPSWVPQLVLEAEGDEVTVIRRRGFA